MRKIFMIISAVLCNLLGCTAQQQNFESLNVEAFEKVISDTSIVRLDVRSIDEYASGHIAKAINIDVMKDASRPKRLPFCPRTKPLRYIAVAEEEARGQQEYLQKTGIR